MGKCYYCGSDGEMRVSKDESAAKVDLHVCDMHWDLLKKPETAIPLIRGDLSLKLRGRSSSLFLKKKSEEFIKIISKWTPKAD